MRAEALAIIFMACILMSPALVSADNENLPWDPTHIDCQGSDFPRFTELPTMGNWHESYDGSNNRDYVFLPANSSHCNSNLSNNADDIVYLSTPVTKIGNEYKILGTGTDSWLSTPLTNKNNLRDVHLRFDYYVPFYPTGDCIHNHTLNDNSMWIGIANHRANFSEAFWNSAIKPSSTFHIVWNGLWNQNIECGKWITSERPISYFTDHDERGMEKIFGNSFVGYSKGINAVSFQVGNMYIKKVQLIDGDQTIELW